MKESEKTIRITIKGDKRLSIKSACRGSKF